MELNVWQHEHHSWSTAVPFSGSWIAFFTAENRKIQELKNSPFWWLRAKGRLLSSTSEVYRIIFTLTEHKLFDQFILFVVLLNTGVLVAQTFETIIVIGGKSKRSLQ